MSEEIREMWLENSCLVSCEVSGLAGGEGGGRVSAMGEGILFDKNPFFSFPLTLLWLFRGAISLLGDPEASL